jgi:hypothetical protein
MKIIIKDNFSRDLFTETVVSENVNEVIGNQMVQTWNDKYWHEDSQYYLALVEDDYELYDGYAELI